MTLGAFPLDKGSEILESCNVINKNDRFEFQELNGM